MSNSLNQKLALVLLKQSTTENPLEVSLPGWSGMDSVVSELEKNHCLVVRDGDKLTINAPRLAA